MSGFALPGLIWGLPQGIAGRQINPQEFALFSIGIQWFSIACLVPNVMNRVTLPRAVDAVSRAGLGNDGRVPRDLLWRARLAQETLVVSGLTFAFAPLLIRLYGPIFVDGEAILGFFVLASVLFALSSVVGGYPVATEERRIWMIAALPQMTTAIVVTWYFVDLGAVVGAFGISVGAAVAFVIAVTHLRGGC